nr:unnamed protein product [Callosobruchus chinensis]
MQHIDERKRLTVDWENVVRDQVAASRRVSTIQQLTYDSLVGHYGQVEFDTELARFCTGSSYEGSANKLADTKRVRTIDHKILRVVAPEEEAIIKKQYRRGGDHSVGLNRDLYEFWTMGRQSEISDIHSLEDTQSPGFATPEKSIDRDSSSEFTLMKY